MGMTAPDDEGNARRGDFALRRHILHKEGLGVQSGETGMYG
jgi:hypothetical protein